MGESLCLRENRCRASRRLHPWHMGREAPWLRPGGVSLSLGYPNDGLITLPVPWESRQASCRWETGQGLSGGCVGKEAEGWWNSVADPARGADALSCVRLGLREEGWNRKMSQPSLPKP